MAAGPAKSPTTGTIRLADCRRFTNRNAPSSARKLRCTPVKSGIVIKRRYDGPGVSVFTAPELQN
jgi:hypothetical protein